MVVRRLKVFLVEATVRGYITGSAWAEYKKIGTVHGIKMREGMVEIKVKRLMPHCLHQAQW